MNYQSVNQLRGPKRVTAHESISNPSSSNYAMASIIRKKGKMITGNQKHMRTLLAFVVTLNERVGQCGARGLCVRAL